MKWLAVLPFLVSPVLGQEFDMQLPFDPCTKEYEPPIEYTEIKRWPDEVYYVSMDEVRKHCDVPSIYYAYGCYVQYEYNIEVIYLYDTGDPVANACVLKHELAHVQGWLHD